MVLLCYSAVTPMLYANEMKEPVKIREKRLKDGSVSLYLDIYMNGKRQYEFLSLYLSPLKKDSEKNKQVMMLAEQMKQKKIDEVRSYALDVVSPQVGNAHLFEAFENFALSKLRKDSRSTYVIYMCVLKLIKAYDASNPKLSKITSQWVQDFKNYIDEQPLKLNSKWEYFQRFQAFFNFLAREELIVRNPVAKVKGFAREENIRVYLTEKEISAVAAVACKEVYKIVQDAFLFSCLTGLRFSDIYKLRWGDVIIDDKYTRIIFEQKKTKSLEYLDIPEQAVSLMGNRGEDSCKVFAGLPPKPGTHLGIIIKAAGISRHVTFHAARHTFAVLMLNHGVDIYTLSKLLGHRELETTQVYAHLSDEKKKRAIDSLPRLL